MTEETIERKRQVRVTANDVKLLDALGHVCEDQVRLALENHSADIEADDESGSKAFVLADKIGAVCLNEDGTPRAGSFPMNFDDEEYNYLLDARDLVAVPPQRTAS